MNRQERLMSAISWESKLCPICGRIASNRHHAIYRSQGGSNGPTVTICGNGNMSGCHGLIHQGYIHLDYFDGRWMYLRSDKPISNDEADKSNGWLPFLDWDRIYGAWGY